MACHTLPDTAEMEASEKSWLQLYVDAMTEKDPYKRLALVQQLRKMPKHDESEELAQGPVVRPVKPVVRALKKSKLARR
jgi:hypothetical protein